MSFKRYQATTLSCLVWTQKIVDMIYCLVNEWFNFRPFTSHDEYNVTVAVRDEGDEYDFSHASRGTAIIFNMKRVKNSKGEIKERDGASIDADRLSETFKHLGFHVCVKEDQTKKQMIKLLKGGN